MVKSGDLESFIPIINPYNYETLAVVLLLIGFFMMSYFFM
jgi:hypothetical protein